MKKKTEFNAKAYKAKLRETFEDIKGVAADVNVKMKIDKIAEIVTFSCKKLDEEKLAAAVNEIDEYMNMFATQVEKNISANIDMVGERLTAILKRIF